MMNERPWWAPGGLDSSGIFCVECGQFRMDGGKTPTMYRYAAPVTAYPAMYRYAPPVTAWAYFDRVLTGEEMAAGQKAMLSGDYDAFMELGPVKVCDEASFRGLKE